MKRFIIVCLCLVATVSLLFAAYGCGKKENEKQPDGAKTEKVYAFDLGAVRLEEGTLLEKQRENENYLKSLNVDKLLYFYYRTAGLQVRNNVLPYGGWEAGNTGGSVAGHTLGHYLSAISMLYAETEDEWYRNTVNDIVSELKRCQNAAGYVFPRPESDFDAVLRGTGDSGVIFYTMHKVLAGLLDAYKYAYNDDALVIASDLINWTYSKVSTLNTNQIEAMLRIEYGGMNEVCYSVYEITKDERHLKVAQIFDEKLHLYSWSNGSDNLSGLHANTQIPKAVGFAKGYMVTGDKSLLQAAEYFWDIVVNKRTFATGGNAENEHFGPAGVISDQLYFNPDETCNIYNMCKLSSYLYEITGENKYADYLERALLNGIAGSIDEDGCKTYYQWLSTDATKLFHSAEESFWCCTGTGMESFSKLASTLGYKTDKGVKINIFQSATYNYNETSFSLENDGEKNKITFLTGGKFELQLRVPYYANGTLLVVNGTTVQSKEEGGYIKLNRTFNAGDVIDYQINYGAYAEPTFDDKDVFAVKYGPYLLAAVGKRYEKRNYIAAAEAQLSDLSGNVTETDGGYVMDIGGEMIPMKRYCDIVDETYTAYFQRVNELPDEVETEDIAMRSEVITDLAYSKKHSAKMAHNIWYDYSGSCAYLEAVNDGYVGVDSLAKSPYSNSLFAFYVPYCVIPAGNHWIGLDFGSEKEISSLSVYFYDNYALVKAPESYSVQYWTGSTWTDVSNRTEATTARDRYNTVSFDKVTTSRVRITMYSPKQTGIIEIKVK